MTLSERIVEVMADHRGAAHVNEISEMLLVRYPNLPVPAENLPGKVSAVLSSDARKKRGKAKFSRVKKQVRWIQERCLSPQKEAGCNTCSNGSACRVEPVHRQGWRKRSY